MPSLRTKSISTKVTDEEYAQMEALAVGKPSANGRAMYCSGYPSCLHGQWRSG